MNLIKNTAIVAGICASLAFLPTAVMAGNPTPSVISFDHGSLDTLDALGLGDHVLAVPKQSLPAYLAEYANDDTPDAGGLKSPDLDVINKLQPDMVLMSGRQGDALDGVSGDITLVDVTPAEAGFSESMNKQVLDLAARFDATEKAQSALDELWDYVEAQKQSIEPAPAVLVVTHNDGNYSLRQEAVVSELLGLTAPEVPEHIETVSRGTRTFTPLPAEAIAQMAPDIILVVDRSAAIGATPLEQQTLVSQLKEHNLADPKVTILSPGLWYLSGGGLQSTRLQINEVLEAVR